MQIKIDDVGFSYSSIPVLKDVAAELDGPAFVSILGPNGVGKSTLMHCINKILEPTEGAVLIDGRDVKGIHIKELAKEVGYVPYSANDTFPLSVVDTVLMGRHPYSRWGTLDRDLDIVYDTLDLLGISDLAMRPFNELSAGQHQKVMLARGLVQEPRVLLLDEPTSNLDVRHQLDVAKLLRRLSVEKGILVVMICHDINIAAKYSDSIILMNEGTIYAVGTPREVITEENLREVYGVLSEIADDDGRPHVILKDSLRRNGMLRIRQDGLGDEASTLPEPPHRRLERMPYDKDIASVESRENERPYPFGGQMLLDAECGSSCEGVGPRDAERAPAVLGLESVERDIVRWADHRDLPVGDHHEDER